MRKAKKAKVFLNPSQMDFYKSTRAFTLFAGGLGSGKTHAGAFWAISMALKYPHVVGLITANSHSQLRKATVSKIFELLEQLEIHYEFKSQEGILLIGDARIYCISMERFDLLRGIEAGWAWSDECAFYKEEAFNVLIGRIRDNDGPCQWKGTTTPNGFNWLYTAFVEQPIMDSEVVHANTEQNLANLSSTYVELLKSQYDSRLAQQELAGQFVNLNSGMVYYAFNRHRNSKPHTDDGYIIYCGLDFNVHPLCGVFCIQREGKIIVTKELWLENSNTFQAAKEIVQRYPSQTVYVIPDETGNRRRSSSNTTDHEILRRANLSVVPFRNPGVKDRQNNVNRLLDQGLLEIHPDCKKLIADLEKLTHENIDPMLGHMSDALGYACWHLNPLERPRRDVTITYR